MSMDIVKGPMIKEDHDMINLYSTIEGALTKGSLVEYAVANPDSHNGFGDSLGNVPGYAFSHDYVVNFKVTAATSGTRKVAGLLYEEVVTNINDPWTVDARYVDPAKLAEKQVVPSGRSVRFYTKGIFPVTGIDTSLGIAGPGSGAYVSNSGAGIVAVGSGTSTDARLAGPRVGTFITSSGANGMILLKLNIPN